MCIDVVATSKRAGTPSVSTTTALSLFTTTGSLLLLLPDPPTGGSGHTSPDIHNLSFILWHTYPCIHNLTCSDQEVKELSKRGAVFQVRSRAAASDRSRYAILVREIFVREDMCLRRYVREEIFV